MRRGDGLQSLSGESKMTPELKSNPEKSSFEKQAGQRAPGVIREFWDFLRFNKKWWLTPIIVIMLLLGAVILMGGTAAAPFIYTLF
jgi:hypothetical protein